MRLFASHTLLMLIGTCLASLVSPMAIAATPTSKANTTSRATAAIDWTPFFSPMLNGCHFPTMDLDDPKLKPAYKKSIVNKKRVEKGRDMDAQISDIYQLNHAAAFGYPLTKIEIFTAYETQAWVLYFGTADFYNLRPLFKAPSNAKQTATGYSYYDWAYTDLIFDQKARSITCLSHL